MKRTLLLPSFAAALMMSATTSNAALTAFTDYQYGGLNASWDIFHGTNYNTNYSLATGTEGNPSNGTIPLTLTAVQTSHNGFPGYAGPTGPIGSGSGPDAGVPGNRDQYYTLFSNITFGVTGAVTSDVTVFTLQVLASITPADALFNGLAPTMTSSAAGLSTYTWSGLDLENGDNFSLSFKTVGSHNAFDAVQIQAGPIPEPSGFALLGLGLAAAAFRRRRA